jgi:hypothetical protein
VKENGDIFGVYSVATWPALNAAKGHVTYHTDMLCNSFIFSLANTKNTPIEPYRVLTSPVCVSQRGIHIGVDTEHAAQAAVMLMYEGRSAYETKGNFAYTDVQRAAAGAKLMKLPDGVTTLAGCGWFTAETIEVHSVPFIMGGSMMEVDRMLATMAAQAEAHERK